MRETLREWRLRQRWTQADAARWYGCSIRTWRRYETGETPTHVKLRTLERDQLLKFKREIQ